MEYRLKAYRNARRLTQAQVAEALGTSTNHYAMMERGDRPVRAEHLETLAGFYGCKSSDLIVHEVGSASVQQAILRLNLLVKDGELPLNVDRLLQTLTNLEPSQIDAVLEYATLQSRVTNR